ncbi:hypothetical protein KPL70_023117 [Citrus sinensis]|nr:hypothetical protein KPL70_023117 [Citrus sinensis]
MVNASANGALLSKSYTEAYEILERIANNNYQWPSTRMPTTRGEAGVHNIDAITTLSAQVTSLTNMGAGEYRPTTVTPQLAGRSHAYPEGKIKDVLVKVEKFIFPVDFIVLDFEVDKEVLIILGRPFLATGKTLIDVQKGDLTMRVNDQQVTFNVLEAMKNPDEVECCNFLSVVDFVVADRIDRCCSNEIIKVTTFEGFEEENVAVNQIDWMEGKRLLQQFSGATEKVKPYYKGSDEEGNHQMFGCWNHIPDIRQLVEKELLAVVFAFDEFRAYLVGTKVTVYTDHEAIKYLISKKDAKPRLIRWILLLQEFDLEIKDRKETENQVADHLSRCQRARNITQRHEIPLTNILEVEVFYVWGIDFMGPFPPSFGNLYILVTMDYVSKWVEAATLPTNDAKAVVDVLQKNMFSRFDTTRAIISDYGTHFCNKVFVVAMVTYGVRHKMKRQAKNLKSMGTKLSITYTQLQIVQRRSYSLKNQAIEQSKKSTEASHVSAAIGEEYAYYHQILTAIAMPRYKRTANRLKDPSRFQSYHEEEKYEEFIEARKIPEEKGF